MIIILNYCWIMNVYLCINHYSQCQFPICILNVFFKSAFGGEHRTSRFVTTKLHNDRPGLVLAGRTDVSLTKAVASVDKVSANVHVQLSVAERNYTLGSVVGVGLRYAMEQQAVSFAVLLQGVHLVGERLVVAVEGRQLALHGCHRRVGLLADIVHGTDLVDALIHGVECPV